MKPKYIECNCSCSEHSLRFTYFPDDEHFPIYINTFLGDYDNIFKRIWTAIKYVFGRTCKYGYFSECMLEFGQVQELIDILEEAKIKPSKKTVKAMCECEKGNCKKFNSVEELMKDLEEK